MATVRDLYSEVLDIRFRKLWLTGVILILCCALTARNGRAQVVPQSNSGDETSQSNDASGTDQTNCGQPGEAPCQSGQQGTAQTNCGQPGEAPCSGAQQGTTQQNCGYPGEMPCPSGQQGTTQQNCGYPAEMPCSPSQQGAAQQNCGYPGEELYPPGQQGATQQNAQQNYWYPGEMPCPPSQQGAAQQNCGYPSEAPCLNGQQRRVQPNCGWPGEAPCPAWPERGPRPIRNVELPSFYRDIPSLFDLYTQIPSAEFGLRRFGSDAFLMGTGNVNELPMDLPVGPDYVLGPGDNLMLNMWGGVSSRLSLTIDRQGEIALPEAGTVSITGLTIAEAQSAIQKALGTQFQNEHVELSLGRVRSVRIYVVGDVQRPGAYDVSSLSTPLNALFEAGGPTSRGSLRILEQYRGKQLVQKIDLYDFLLRGIRTNVGRLEAGDTILVPTVGPQVTVEGMVHRPAIYELNGEKNLQQVLNLAGGVMITASLKQINVERVVAHERRTMLSLQLSGDPAQIAKEMAAFHIQSGDDVIISQILPYNQQAVYLEGHVFRPGKYAYHEGMTLDDLLRSYQDVMPEPAAHGEIIRLMAPDYRPETISFNLPDVLIGNDSIALQPFDVVRIFGRYEIDPPKVSIFGAVLRPGVYPMSEGLTVAGLVRMAGGFNRSAYRKEADLSNYEVEDGQRVLVSHSVVAVGAALAGDKSADVPLQPGDVVGIRQLTGWQDIGQSITIDGEVKFAGTYGIDDGERLSSVIRRAGGFRSDAYPEGAVLERVEVRRMEEVNRQELIRRIQSTTPQVSLVNGSAQDQQSLLTSMRQQQEEVLTALRNHPPTGRLVIRISSDVSKWENTPADIIVRAGDTLTVPKRPDFVLVSGQVYNATGITYRPGRSAGWYLAQAGGATRDGDKKEIFILRADGAVVGNHKATIFDPGILRTRMQPGDSIIVPEKVTGGSMLWRNVLGTAQIASSLALTGAVAGAF